MWWWATHLGVKVDAHLERGDVLAKEVLAVDQAEAHLQPIVGFVEALDRVACARAHRRDHVSKRINDAREQPEERSSSKP
jgi:hypothetical protein